MCSRFISLVGLPEAYLDGDHSHCCCDPCFVSASNMTGAKIDPLSKGWCCFAVQAKNEPTSATKEATTRSGNQRFMEHEPPSCGGFWIKVTFYHPICLSGNVAVPLGAVKVTMANLKDVNFSFHLCWISPRPWRLLRLRSLWIQRAKNVSGVKLSFRF